MNNHHSDTADHDGSPLELIDEIAALDLESAEVLQTIRGLLWPTSGR